MFVTDVVLYTKYSEGVTRGHRIWLRMLFSISSGLGQFVADSVDHSEGVLKVSVVVVTDVVPDHNVVASDHDVVALDVGRHGRAQ